MTKKWIQAAIKKPGALRKSMGIKKGEKIPMKDLKKAAKTKAKQRETERLAITLKGLKQ